MRKTENRGGRGALLAEIGLILLLIVLAMVLYFQPAAEGALNPRWWHWLVLGILFFAAVGLATWRRQRQSHHALHQTIRESSDGTDSSR